MDPETANYSAIIGGRRNEVKFVESIETASDVAHLGSLGNRWWH